jgi:hypothetical protein
MVTGCGSLTKHKPPTKETGYAMPEFTTVNEATL